MRPQGLNVAFKCDYCDKIDLAGFPPHKCLLTATCNFKIGDKVRYKNHSIDGAITGQQGEHWVINNALLALPDEIELVGSLWNPYTETRFDKKCTCGSTAVGSDRHSDWCDIK